MFIFYLLTMSEKEIDIWYDTIYELEKYFIDTNKLPSSTDKKEKIRKMRYWLCCQLQNAKENKNEMKDQYIKSYWEAFVSKYSHII